MSTEVLRHIRPSGPGGVLCDCLSSKDSEIVQEFFTKPPHITVMQMGPCFATGSTAEGYLGTGQSSAPLGEKRWGFT